MNKGSERHPRTFLMADSEQDVRSINQKQRGFHNAPLPDGFQTGSLPYARPSVYPERAMYEDFVATDRWTSEKLHCVWKGTVVAIATRHADATDIRFAINGKPLWIAMPNQAWVEQKRRNGKVITDYLAAQAAGRYLKQAIESGYDNGREMYTMSVDEVLHQVAAVVEEAGHTANLPTLPVIGQKTHPEEFDYKLPGEPQSLAETL